MPLRPKVGLDLSPIAFRSRAPGTAVLVENQARALLAMDVGWDWVIIATPRVLRYAPFFRSFEPIVSTDAPLSYHVCLRLGGLWARAGCSLGLATAFFCPLTGPPSITNYFDANAYHPVRDERTLKAKLKSAVIRSLCAVSRRHSRALITLSNYSRARMIEADPASESKWIVAPCGCPSIGSPPAEAPLWARKLDARGFILYTGAFSENKNQRRLIEAWDQLRRRHEALPSLVLIGPCPADYLHDVIAPARARAFRPDEIIIPGFVESNEVAWAYHAAHAYVQPSFAEGFGMPVVEAMSCGVPVACSDSTSLPEVAGDAAILFDPLITESISRALESLVFDESRRTELIRLGFQRSKLFTWEQHAAIVSKRIRQELTEILAATV
jgi:glycosyltransferase involved in cell wall biosynthesis